MNSHNSQVHKSQLASRNTYNINNNLNSVYDKNIIIKLSKTINRGRRANLGYPPLYYPRGKHEM